MYPSYLEGRGEFVNKIIEEMLIELIYNKLPAEPEMSDKEASDWMDENVYKDSEKYLEPLFEFIKEKLELVESLK